MVIFNSYVKLPEGTLWYPVDVLFPIFVFFEMDIYKLGGKSPFLDGL
jgi:hypothetical protein